MQAYTPAERRRTQLLLAAYRALGPARFIVSGVVEVPLSERTREDGPQAQRYVEECVSTADRAGLTNAVRCISLGRSDLTRDLEQVTTPTLVVTSPDHSGFSLAQAEAAAQLLPRGELGLIDGPAYLTPLEAHSATAELVRAFWARVEGADSV